MCEACVCVCVCVCVCLFVCTVYVCVYACMHICIHACLCIVFIPTDKYVQIESALNTEFNEAHVSADIKRMKMYASALQQFSRVSTLNNVHTVIILLCVLQGYSKCIDSFITHSIQVLVDNLESVQGVAMVSPLTASAFDSYWLEQSWWLLIFAGLSVCKMQTTVTITRSLAIC